MDGSRQQQQQQQIQQILQQALASSNVPASHNQLSPVNSSVLAQLAPLSTSASRVICASPLPIQYSMPTCSSAVTPLAPAVGRIIYTQPASLAGAGGFAVLSPSGGGFTALQVIGAGHQLGSAGGMVVVPTSVGSTFLPNQLRSPTVTNTPVLPPFLIRHGGVSSVSPIHDSGSQLAVRNVSVSPISSRTSGSATVHHLGTSDTKESPFVHLRGHLQSVKSQESSLKLSSVLESSRRSSAESLESEKPLLKRIKLEVQDDDLSAKVYNKLYIDSHERDLAEIRASYQDHMTELFFLENNGNLMEYLGWSKRPNVHLNRMLQAESLDADVERAAGEEEKRINNEVKVLTTVGSTIPIITPVAIATTLPAAITALQQQELASGLSLLRKAGGRHGMVFGYVPPKSSQLLPLVPGGMPLSPKAATTTVGSPPPYVMSCSTALPVATIAEPLSTKVTVSTYGTQPENLAGILSRPALCESPSISGSADRFVGTVPVSVFSTTNSTTVSPTVLTADLDINCARDQLVVSVSNEAVIDQAKQEAQVLQRISDLRRQGMWSARRLPKVQESVRCKSQWDYLLDEMQWLAVDFAQERRWKMAAAKKLSGEVLKYHAKMEEKQRQKAIEMTGLIARMVREFWANMTETAYCLRQRRLEEKRNNLLEYITQDMLLNVNNKDVDVDVNGLDHCYSTVGEVCNEKHSYQDEIDDLIREGEMPLQELVDKYAGAYDVNFVLPPSPESIMSDESCSSDESNASEPFVICTSNQAFEKCADVKCIEEINSFAQAARPCGNTLLHCQVKVTQPQQLKLSLREYQLIGIDWMTAVCRPGMGCILADAAGLGKKVQTIGFLAYLASECKSWGPHLVVMPSCYMLAWEIEFERCFPACRTFVYYGDVDGRKKLRKDCHQGAADHHVFITSYNILLEDFEYFLNTEWHCLILDKIDYVIESDVFPSVLSLSSRHNILLTNSDLVRQSNKGLASLAQLLTTKTCRTDKSMQLECCSSSDLEKLVSLLTLRRNEDELRDQLPKIHETDICCSLSCKQQRIYADLVAKHSGNVRLGRHVTSVLKLLLSIQKLTNHPDLVQPRSVSFSFCMDPLEYRISARVKNAVVHDIWQRAEYDLLDQQLLSDAAAAAAAAAENAIQDQDTDLFVELELIMSAAKPVESSIESNIGIQVDRLCTVLKSDIFLPSVFPYDLCTKLQRNVFSYSSNKEDIISSSRWKSCGYALARAAIMDLAHDVDSPTDNLMNLFHFHTHYAKDLASHLKWLLCVVPAVSANAVSTTAADSSEDANEFSCHVGSQLYLENACTSGAGLISFNQTNATSCGKLMELNRLLTNLSMQSRRAVVLTRMTCMLDILEAFMDSKRYNHLRLDLLVEVEQRRKIVQQFNADKRIECLLMLSRMPVLGLDLPEADVVIFYDFDPRGDMHEHAKVFCHRMALVRDLEIFRLKTSSTVEETMSIVHQSPNLCGTSLETASFSQVTFNGLFQNTLFGDKLVQCVEKLVNTDEEQRHGNDLIIALDDIEDFDDVRAAKLVNTEREMSLHGLTSSCFKHHVKRHKRRRSLSYSFEVENFAVDYIEQKMEPPFDINEMTSELESEPGKDLWMTKVVSSRSKVNHNLEEDSEVDEVLLTYNFESDQLFVDDTSGELMPVWAPPTPPQDDNDLYIDQTQSFVYDPTPMSESQLPSVYVRKGHKRHRVDPLARKQKRARDDLPSVPRSLFDCPQTIAQRMERDARLLKQQGLLKPGLKIQLQQQQQVMTPANNAVGAMIGRPMAEQAAQHESAEWLIYEDWALLQALQTLQEMPLNLLTSSPGHLPNWDLVADVVNGVSRTYRSPKQCKQRYENFILPREEGRVTYDASPRKLKKATKGIYKTKYNRSMRTQQLYVQDNSKASTTLYTLRFDAIKMIAAARTPAARPQPTGAVGAGLKNTKHIAVLAENGINYDQPLSPGHVAAMRAERIAKEVKEKKMASTAGNSVQVDVQPTAQPSQQQQLSLQRPSVAVPSSTLQQLIIQSTQAATGHVILQPGQQLISTGTGQHVLASVDGRPQQMTIVQGTAGSQVGQATVTGTIPAASLLSAGLVKSSGASVGAAGTNVVTAVSLARSLNMAGIIVSQTIAGQTIATINKGQTVVAPFLQAQSAAHVRGALRTPFALKDATSVSIVSQSASGVLNDAAIARVISTTTPLTPAQLVVTQQKPGIVGVSTVPQGTLQQQLLGLSVAQTAGTLAAAAASKGLTTMQPVQVMRQKQVQLRPTMSVQQISQQVNTVSGSMAAIVASGQKTVTVTTPVVSGISPAIQLKSMQNPAAFQEMLKRTQQQQQVAKAVQGTATVAIQQIQVTKAQLLEGMQIQQVPSSVSAQTVATLMKAVSSASTGAVVSSVTLPNATGVSSAINFFPQQKLLAASKIQAQPIRQLQMQKRPATTVQIQNPQKMTAAIQQMTKIQSGSPVIFRPQQVVVQQMPAQQFAKSTQQGVQAPRIQQFISSGPSSATAAVLGTQLIGQPASGSTVTVATPPTVAKTLSVTITTTTLPAAVATVAMSSPAGIAAATLQNAGVPMTATVKLLPTSVTTLVKQIKDPSSASTLAMTSRTPGGSQTIVQQVLIRPGPAVAMSVPSAAGASSQMTLARAGIVGAASAPSLPVIATTVSTSSAANVVPVSPGVQQAVQEVVQQAQAQARQPITAINFVAVTSSTTLQQSPGQTMSSPGVTIIGSTQAGNMQQQQGAGDNTAGSNKSSPYVMRLRNQKS